MQRHRTDPSACGATLSAEQIATIRRLLFTDLAESAERLCEQANGAAQAFDSGSVIGDDAFTTAHSVIGPTIALLDHIGGASAATESRRSRSSGDSGAASRDRGHDEAAGVRLSAARSVRVLRRATRHHRPYCRSSGWRGANGLEPDRRLRRLAADSRANRRCCRSC